MDTPAGTTKAARLDTAALLALVDATLPDLHPDAVDLPPVTLASSLERDLGFDSLGRAELLLRTQQAFGVALPEDTLATVESVADLSRSLQQAGLGSRTARMAQPQPAARATRPPLSPSTAAPPGAGVPQTSALRRQQAQQSTRAGCAGASRRWFASIAAPLYRDGSRHVRPF